MKRMLCLILALTLLTGLSAAAAAEGDALTVAVTTPLTGAFATSLWGSGTSDVDVRALLHGCNLVTWDTERGLFLPDETVLSGLAVTEDQQGNRTYTIALHPDLRYSDGSRITARDYAFAFLLYASPETAKLGGRPRALSHILGWDAYAAGETKVLRGVRLISESQLAITVRAESLPFFYELGLLDCVPYPAAVLAPGVRVSDSGHGVSLEGGAPFTAELLRETLLDPETGYLSHPAVTSGPYRLTAWDGVTAEFEINPYYKGDSAGRKPAIGRLTFTSIPAGEQIRALTEGRVDLINKATGAGVIREGLALTAEGAFSSAAYLRSGLSFLSFAAERPAVADARTRQAVAMLIDRDALVADTVGDYGQRVDGYYGLGQWMFQLVNGTLTPPLDPPEEGTGAGAQRAYEQAVADWEALSLDCLPAYSRAPDRAAALLAEAGWSLNSAGGAWQPGDGIRYRQGAAGLEPFTLRIACARGSSAAEALARDVVEPLRAAGADASLTLAETAELLPQYYRTAPCGYDMIFLASNFELVYDPSAGFAEEEDGSHIWQTSQLRDEELYRRAVAMRRTEPGDLLAYCQAWLAFQERYMEILPAIPVYGNVYFDFFTGALQDYEIAAHATWPEAVVRATLGEP